MKTLAKLLLLVSAISPVLSVMSCIVNKSYLSGGTSTEVIGKVFELREFRGGAVGSPVIPVIPVTCNQCGNLLLFNAIAAKLVK